MNNNVEPKANEKMVLNREYIESLVDDYLSPEHKGEKSIITQRIITEFEIAIFAKIREMCHKYNNG